VSQPVPALRRLTRGAAALAISAAFLTACGGDDPSDGGTASPPAASGDAKPLTATEEDFSISLDQDDLAAGTYAIEVVNDGGATHDLVVEKDGDDIAKSETIGPGKSTTLAVTLEPGEYVFYCSIGNHREMGMEITVSVS